MNSQYVSWSYRLGIFLLVANVIFASSCYAAELSNGNFEEIEKIDLNTDDVTLDVYGNERDVIITSEEDFNENNKRRDFPHKLVANVQGERNSDKDKSMEYSEDENKPTTKSLDQNIEEYYNSVDIEFKNLSEIDETNNGNEQTKKNSSTSSEDINKKTFERIKRNIRSKELSDDDIEEEIYEELVETYDDENVEFKSKENELPDNVEKFYRDTFMDRIIEEMKVKKPQNKSKRQKRDVTYGTNSKGKELTGDTVLHLQSEISDVIKSETDLKGTLLSNNQFFAKQNEKSDSYVDNIMIHPSEFIQDPTPFQSAQSTNGAKESKPYQNEKRMTDNHQGNKRNKKDLKDDFHVETINTDDNESIEDNLTALHNDSDVILAVLDSRKLLKCHLGAATNKSVVWMKDGERVPLHGGSNSPYEMTMSGDLTIKRVGREHQGKWRCEKQGSSSLLDKVKDLVVMESPSPPYLEVFGRRLDPGNVFLPAREGTELMMACHVERGIPNPTLHWETSKPVHMTHQHTRGPQLTSSVAALVVRRSHHNTTISCICKHPSMDTPMVASTLLHVQYAPRFGISRIPGFGFPLEEGSAVSLRCEVDSNPPATPTWRKDEREPPVEQTDDGYLNFTSVRREHSGWYKCSASHPLGNFSSIGYFLNIRYEVESATEQQIYHQTASRNDENLAGGAVQLQCPPGSIGCWSRNSPTPPSSAPVGLIRQDKQGGSYVCSGLSANEASKLHTILGEYNALNGGAPVVYPSNASLTVKEESSVTLEGEFCVNVGESPGRVLWLAQGRALGLPDNYERITTHHSVPTNATSSIECSVAKLSIDRCTRDDSGEYSLVVRGKRGIGEAIFHVLVLESSDGSRLVEQAYSGGSCVKPSILYVIYNVLVMFV